MIRQILFPLLNPFLCRGAKIAGALMRARVRACASVCAYACARVRACVRERVRLCVRLCVRPRACVRERVREIGIRLEDKSAKTKVVEPSYGQIRRQYEHVAARPYVVGEVIGNSRKSIYMVSGLAV